MATNQQDIELIKQQEECFDKIKNLCTNFKKDGASRKTLEYLKVRLGALESHWQEFEQNDIALNQMEVKDIAYFTEDVFNRIKEMYQSTRDKMNDLRTQLLIQGIPDKLPVLTNPNVLTPVAEGTKASGTFGIRKSPTNYLLFGNIDENSTDKKDILMLKQQCNFKAFQRTVNKIDVQTIQEKWDLEDKLNILRSKWEAIDKVHWELDNILKGSNWLYDTEYDRLENTYEDLRKEINKKIWENQHYRSSAPRVEIPEFSGDYNQWTSFKDIFTETIHTNPMISNSQKMQHLKTKLKGEAEKLVQHLSVSADNYESCWDIIQHRYDNKRLLFTSYINSLLNQPSIQQSNAHNIKKMHDVTLECLNALQNIGLDIRTWDPIIVHIISQKLDSSTYGEYVQYLENPRDIPNLEEFIKYLESKFMALETMKNNQPSIRNSNFPPQTQKYESRSNNYKKPERWTKSYTTTIHNNNTCPLCKNDHVLMNCPTFLGMNITNRNVTVAKLFLCRNCLYSHDGRKCNSNKKCKVCNHPHHTFLHDPKFKSQTNANNPSGSNDRSVNNVTQESQETEILLTTVQVMVKNVDGTYVTLRALLDQGSQVSLITENAAQRLRLPRGKASATVSGVGSTLGNSKGSLELLCKSIHTDYCFSTKALILKKLINNLPATKINPAAWEHLRNIKLADPDYCTPGTVEMLLGADIYSEIILDGVLKHSSNAPTAQQTKLGWIICGRTTSLNCFVTLNEMENLTKFWELEEVENKNEATTSDEFCENHYIQTTRRQTDGKYVVKMPFKENALCQLGSSRRHAISQFLQLEKRMTRDKEFSTSYKQFIQEYIDLGHMKPSMTSEDQLQVYLPHHGVRREESTTTKLRVVFNASQKTDTKVSLNDVMEKGPNLQRDILNLIVKWRTHKYVLSADIEKMFRNLALSDEQQCLQKIIWRPSPHEPLAEMQLCTVTYGTKAAPFLAMRTLQQLAEDEGHTYPLAKKALSNDVYMDDVLTGSNTLQSTKQLQAELFDLLKKGGFLLRKWATNDPTIINHLPTELKNEQPTFNFEQEESMKTLGLGWNTKEDAFCFRLKVPQCKEKLTKRMLLSEFSKIYDPVGWLAPIIVKAKLIFQNLWLDNLGWDERVPIPIYKEWELIRSELEYIKQISIPRWIKCTTKEIDIHGYCDASEKAYAGVIYSRVQLDTGDYVTYLLALAKLIYKIQQALSDHILMVPHCWTDSKVTLAWLQGNDNRWDRYVSNRTKQITNIVPAKYWRYVKSKDNPADCASRGLSPKQLVNYSLWWKGPSLLLSKELTSDVTTNDVIHTTRNLVNSIQLTESMKNADGTHDHNNNIIYNLLNKHSSVDRVVRIVALILRFKVSITDKKQLSNYNGYLTINELNDATILIVKNIQKVYFKCDIESILKQGLTNSNIKNLSPILDEKGMLRVGGRLQLASLPYEKRHPIILPHSSHLTELIIKQAHLFTLHGGARLTLAQTRHRFWIIGGNRAVKKVLRQCVKCKRYAPANTQQLMGNLPIERITPSRPFSHTGVDFTGHVEIKINKGRGVKTCKGYIAIFICMSTKAVHIELVSDLSTETFIAALKRMCARRGTPTHIYSDNGTNFVGAARVLNKEFNEYKTLLSPEFFNEINKLRIQWHFNAPLWPTAGGLWEAAVKSMKFHLRRVLGEQKLTFEQFSTLLTSIEACLNSRPLCPITEDPEDLDYLTPGHFLTGGPLTSLPLRESPEVRTLDPRNRWKLVELMQQHFWQRWSCEYLHQLQTKTKWLKKKENIETGDLVLVKENNLPPAKWAMGRISKVHPGDDGNVRVVTLKTQSGSLKRPINKLVPLPVKKTTDTSTCITDNSHSSTSQRKLTDLNKTTSNRNINTNKLSNLLLLLMCSLVTFGSCRANPTMESNYKLTPIEENRPVYFDKISNVQIIHDEWTVLVYYNLSSYWKTTERLKGYVDYLDRICNQTMNPKCASLISQLNHEINDINENNNLLMTHHVSRKKRGYFNGVGSLARSLFGVLDQDFADKYTEDIKKLEANENYQLQLIKNQTTIIEAENNLIKKNEKYIESQFKIIDSYMMKTCEDISKIENRFINMTFTMEINTGAITASLLISDLRRQQEMLINALTDILRGHLDMNLFTPSQLIDQLKYVTGNIDKRLSLPIKDLQRDIREIYKLIYVKARITGKYLLFELHIPLISDDEYSLYRSIPILITRKNKTSIIRQTTDYIASNFVKNTYIDMENKDIEQCIKTDSNNLLCHASHPVYNLYSKSAPCEAQLLSQQNNLKCDLIESECTDKWIRLHRENHWLYSCCNKCPLRIVCDEQVTTSTVLEKTGLITLGQGCIIQKEDATIHSFNTFGNKITINNHIDVPTIDSPNKLLTEKLKDIEYTLKKPNFTYDIESIDRQIHQQKIKENETMSFNIHDITQYSLSSLLLVAATVALCYWVIRRRRKGQKPKQNPGGIDNLGMELREIISEIDATTNKSKRKTVGFSFD